MVMGLRVARAKPTVNKRRRRGRFGSGGLLLLAVPRGLPCRQAVAQAEQGQHETDDDRNQQRHRHHPLADSEVEVSIAADREELWVSAVVDFSLDGPDEGRS